MRQHRLGVGSAIANVQLHGKDPGSGHVVHVQELPHGCATASYHDFDCLGLRRVEESTQERRNDVGILRVKIVTWPIQMGLDKPRNRCG